MLTNQFPGSANCLTILQIMHPPTTTTTSLTLGPTGYDTLCAAAHAGAPEESR